jgi:LysR family glycine cleavage system transcriptional activator
MPPLLALRAFEAVARHGSFKSASQELNVTPGALSQQVRKLEQDLDVALFVRHNRVIEPTESGHRLRAGLTDAFVRIREAVEGVRPPDEAHSVVLAVGPPFAAKWLVPRLASFIERYPDIDIKIAASLRLLDYREHDIDVGVCLSPDMDDSLESEWLAEESMLALASPSFIEQQKLREPKDILRVPILSDNCKDWNDKRATWEGWFAAVGLPEADARRGIHFGSNVDQALDAAVAGLGVVLGHRVMASMDIAQGRLESPFGPELGTRLKYQVVCRKRSRIPENVIKVRDWLIDELKKSTTFGGQEYGPPDR